jgi:LuxR family maltose regulon positive regulatory protein
MDMPLLKTKLYIPPLRPDRVSRPHLIERLNESVQPGRKLVLVSAPAGFGKTTLLGEWAHAAEKAGEHPARGCSVSPIPYSLLPAPQFAWISLDEGDNDPLRFSGYLIAALQTFQGAGKAGLATLGSSAGGGANAIPAIKVMLARLINDLAERRAPAILVLDDYHLVLEAPVHDIVAFLLDHMPPQMHLAIATRADPPLPLARWRARGQLTELRQSDLRFSTGEAAVLFNQVQGLSLAAEDVAALARRTEGWIVGLQLAALSMRGRGDADQRRAVVEAFAGGQRHILDYLVEEVLDRQPEAVQAFLLQTSILERMCAPLCDAVTMPPCPDAQAMLEYLERANLFVVPLDDERRWYRYHHLFADALRQRLQRSSLPRAAFPGAEGILNELHRRASAWYRENGLPGEAIAHALAAADFHRAADLLDAHAETMWGQGAQTTLARWFAALPDGEILARPRLCAVQAMVLYMSGQRERAEGRLCALDEEQSAALQGMIAAARALVAYLSGEVPAVIRHARRALELLPGEEALWRSSAAMNLGDAYRWCGDHAAADRAYQAAWDAAQAAGDAFIVVMAEVKQALVLLTSGQLRRAMAACERALGRLEREGALEMPLAGGLHAVRGDIQREWNDLDGALASARKACSLSEQGVSVGLIGLSGLLSLRVMLARDDLPAAHEALAGLEELSRLASLPVWIDSGMAAWKAQVWIVAGDLEAAAGLLAGRGVGVDDEEVPYPRQGEYFALARLLLAQGRHRDAARLLAGLRARAEAGGQRAWLIGALALQALACRAGGDLERALDYLARALALAEPEGLVRVFVDEGPPLAELLSALDATPHGLAVSGRYVHELLAAMGHAPGVDSGRSSLLDPLSERERQVLRLLASPMSSAEIAQELVVSVNTVRTHVHKIYSKLDVHSRPQAVVRARELGLL